MQLGILNLLLGISNGALNSGTSQGGNSAAADIFAQFLSDSGQGNGHQAPTGGQLLGDISASTLVAQEVDAQAAKQLDALNDLLAKEISADDAASLLAQLDAMGGELGGGADGLLAQFKAALTEIKDSKTPQTVGALLTQMPALHAAPLERAPALERMLAWMKDALAKKTDGPTQDATLEDGEETAASALLQSLQASMFRDADAAAQAQAEENKSRDFIEIIPLSTAVEATPAWVKQITEAGGGAAEIPGLDVAENDNLPHVNLPKMNDGKVTDLMQFRAMMENSVAQQSDHPMAADAEPVVSSIHGIGNHTAVNDHRGVASLTASHSGLVNHAPVAEQVQVSIQRATKEGIDQMTIQLEPADLGRVEVKIQTNAEGQTLLSFVVDKAETLDSLARDARSLERMLQDAGVKADAGSMQFNLRQQQEQAGDGQSGHGRAPWDDEADAVTGPQAAAASQNYTLTLRDGVDIRA